MRARIVTAFSARSDPGRRCTAMMHCDGDKVEVEQEEEGGKRMRALGGCEKAADAEVLLAACRSSSTIPGLREESNSRPRLPLLPLVSPLPLYCSLAAPAPPDPSQSTHASPVHSLRSLCRSQLLPQRAPPPTNPAN